MNDSALVALAKVLERLPVYIFEFIAQTLIAVCSDFTVTSLLLGAVALLFVTNVWWALSAFFILLVISRMLNSVANAIVLSGQTMAAALRPPAPNPERPMALVPTIHPPGHMVVSGDEAHS